MGSRCNGGVSHYPPDVTGNNSVDYEVNRNSSHFHGESVPGEFIVKLKTGGTANAPARLKAANSKIACSSPKLQAFLTSKSLLDAEPLMTLTGATVAPKFAKGLNGKPVADTDLSGLYLLRFDPQKAMEDFSLIEDLKNQEDVEYVEPNYVVRICAKPSTYTSDPLYSQQWGPAAIGLDKLWEVPSITTKRSVIAILDTGVDITHPDLAENIWTNPMEADGADSRDDGGNGYVDDLHGWDFVNKTGRMRDNNGHGTHCAGIAGVTGGNGIGITGANPDAYIMPIAVLQSNGTGDVATIIKGIDYAAANGADVISMSFGTYAESLALKDALGKAYQKAVLVAAAGNDFTCINPHKCPINGNFGAPMYPGAISFVLGVEASANESGTLAGFSNYDDDGPITSRYSDLKNYELRAPGTSIISTFPNGQYRALNGTSMSTPLVAGAISRLMDAREISTKEELFGDLIATSKGNIDIFGAYSLTDADRKPTLSLVTYRLDDEKMGDGDGRPDAGETIRIYPTFRNSWGNARNITYKVRLAETEDPEILEFIDNGESHCISNLSSYASAEAENPFIVKISPECVDGRIICLELVATCDNITGELVQPIEFTVENGVELGGVLTEDMTLTPNKNYIVSSNLAVPDNVTLTILAGTTIKFKNNTGLSVSSKGKLKAEGEPGKMIRFTKTDLGYGIVNQIYCYDTLKYVVIDNLDFHSNNSLKNCLRLNNCVYKYNSGSYTFDGYFRSEQSTLINNVGDNYYTYSSTNVKFSNIIKNSVNKDFQLKHSFIDPLEFVSCNTFNNLFPLGYQSLGCFSTTPVIVSTDCYLGSSNKKKVSSSIWDIKNPNVNTFAQINLDNMRTRPFSEAHGIVWKVVVNGYDAQDEYDWLAPLGVGRHKFEVYFNRRMNHDKTPFIAMGVREPYTQVGIAEDGEWRTENFDGDEVDIYTAYLTIKGKDNFDGVNTIYVSDAEDDEFFEIPIEDVRFHVNVQSAGSMSNGFEAEAGVGKVTLTWENPEENFDDMLGYNMYRYTLDENDEPTEAVRINETLLTDETLVDYDITPGTTYCYYYKVLRTSLDENSASKVVAATPRAAGKGDANGSGAVDVSDVVTEVNYMIGQEPKPFIFDAADVNDDLNVDILDVVGTVNLILHPQTQMAAVQSMATYSIVDDILYVESPVELGGLQLELSANRENTEFRVLDGLKGFETAGDWISPNDYRFLAFSLSGNTISTGKKAIMALDGASLTDIKLVDPAGNRVMAFKAEDTGISSITGQQMLVPNPNPFSDRLNVPVKVGTTDNCKVEISLVSLSGQTMLAKSGKFGYGEHNVTLDTTNVPAGFYLLTLTVDGQQVQTAKVVKL